MNNIMSLISPGDVDDISGKATPTRTVELHTQQEPVAIEPPIVKHETEPEEFEYVPIADVLKAQRADGTYRYATNISQEQRDQLVRYAEYKSNDRFQKNLNAFAASVEQGNCPSVELLDKQHAEGVIDDRTYLAQKPFVERYLAKANNDAYVTFVVDATLGEYPSLEELENQWKSSAISDREYLERRKIIETLIAADQKEENRQQQAIFRARLESTPVPISPQKQAIFRTEQYEEALKIASGDFEVFNQLRKQIDQRMEGNDPFVRDDKGKLVKDMIDQMEKAGNFAYKGDEYDAMQADRKLQFYAVGRQMLQDGKSVSDIQKEIEGLNQAWQGKRITQLFNNSGRMKKSASNGKIFNSTASGFGGRGTTFFGGDTTVNRMVHKRRLEEDGWIDADDIVAEKSDSAGRVMWELKDGRKVYADDYAND